MGFQPRMENEIEGFSVRSGPRRRVWDGMVADLWDVKCASYAGGRYYSSDPRLFIVLDHQGRDWPSVRRSTQNHNRQALERLEPISFIPADMDIWLDFSDTQSVQHLDIHFDADHLMCRFGNKIDPRQLAEPSMSSSDGHILTLAQLIASELESPNPLHDLYGDGLITALLVDVLKLPKLETRQRSALAPWQLRRATDYIDAHCLSSIRLEELAALAGMSQSHFSHSFKASTGLSPHVWQIKARLRLAKDMLRKEDYSLTDIAAETGFSDHSHFSRVFRGHVGMSPSQWRKSSPS